MSRYYAAVQVPATVAPAMILAGWQPGDRYRADRWPVWLHQFAATAEEAIALCQTPGVVCCLAEKRPGGELIWPREEALTAPAAAARQEAVPND